MSFPPYRYDTADVVENLALAPSDDQQTPPAPPAVEAAALGLRIERDSMDHGWVCPTNVDGNGMITIYVDADDCARAALEAFHARQQAPSTAWPTPLATGGRAPWHPPAPPAKPSVTPQRLLELATEGLEVAKLQRSAALAAEAWAARVRGAVGGGK